MMIRKLLSSDFRSILEVVNEAALVYKGVIPDDRWKEPYMSEEELLREIESGVVFYGWIESGVSDLMSYNSIGQQTGEINHSSNAVYFSFGRSFTEKLSIGVSLKILFEFINDGTDEFDYSSKGVGIDFGVFINFPMIS